MILVSACLLGLGCRYDAHRIEIPSRIKNLLQSSELIIPVCPEQLGGLPTPRPKSYLRWEGSRPCVINEEGKGVAAEFISGAEETLRIAELFGVTKAIFKSRSPSCGEDGVTTVMLRKAKVEVEVIEASKTFADG